MTGKAERTESTVECYYNKFYGIQCKNVGVWVSAKLGSVTDDWTWCNAHRPKHARRLVAEPEAPCSSETGNESHRGEAYDPDQGE